MTQVNKAATRDSGVAPERRVAPDSGATWGDGTPPGGYVAGAGGSHHVPFGIFKDLERPGDVFRDLGPNWFAAVMGTGIVANAAAVLPVRVTGLRVAATGVWALAAGCLVALTVAWAVHWIRFRERAVAHAENPVMAQFWGAPAMALVTVGAGTLVLGQDWIGLRAAVDADWVLWIAGTGLGLVTACWIPYLMMTRLVIGPDSAFGGWLMPVVPPMVSAATGALLIPHAAAGQVRLTLLLACYAMFGISLFAAVIIISLIWSRLVVRKIGPAVMVPTLWIVLGPLGQSVTAAGNLGTAAAGVLPRPYATGAAVFALLYGLPTWGFAMMWLALAVAITVRTARRRLPFALTWWSFTFPVGTCVTGTISLAARSHADALRGAAVLLFLLLVAAWLVVAVRTAIGSASGRLLLPMARDLRLADGALPGGQGQFQLEPGARVVQLLAKSGPQNAEPVADGLRMDVKQGGDRRDSPDLQPRQQRPREHVLAGGWQVGQRGQPEVGEPLEQVGVPEQQQLREAVVAVDHWVRAEDTLPGQVGGVLGPTQ